MFDKLKKMYSSFLFKYLYYSLMKTSNTTSFYSLYSLLIKYIYLITPLLLFSIILLISLSAFLFSVIYFSYSSFYFEAFKLSSFAYLYSSLRNRNNSNLYELLCRLLCANMKLLQFYFSLLSKYLLMSPKK